MRYELTSDLTPIVAPVIQQELTASIEEIDHGIHTLKHLIDRLDTIKKETESFTTSHADDVRLPQEVVRFHARKEMVETERQIREAIEDVFGEQSPEFRKHQHLRIGLGSKTGIPDALRVLHDLTFRLEEKRLHLLGGRARPGDHTPDIDPLTDLYTSRLLNLYFAQELDRSKRNGYTLALAYFSLPDWYEVAALYGSTVWEEVAIGFACASKAALRGYDYATRRSEHEFALLLPQTETQGAHVVIRRIAEQFDAAVNRLVPDLKVMLEFGTATFPFDGETLSTLFEIATVNRMHFTEDLKNVRMLSRASM
ncbi:MAG: diguanylate cyclase [Nitrospirales bacterium]